MKALGITLIILGIIGLIIGGMMFGDIGIAAWIGSIVSLLTGAGFINVNKKFKELNR